MSTHRCKMVWVYMAPYGLAPWTSMADGSPAQASTRASLNGGKSLPNHSPLPFVCRHWSPAIRRCQRWKNPLCKICSNKLVCCFGANFQRKYPPHDEGFAQIQNLAQDTPTPATVV